MTRNADFFISSHKITQAHEEEGEEKRQKFRFKTFVLISLCFKTLNSKFCHTAQKVPNSQFPISTPPRPQSLPVSQLGSWSLGHTFFLNSFCLFPRILPRGVRGGEGKICFVLSPKHETFRPKITPRGAPRWEFSLRNPLLGVETKKNPIKNQNK